MKSVIEMLNMRFSQVCHGRGLAKYYVVLRKGPSLRPKSREVRTGRLRFQHRLCLLRVVHLLLLIPHAESLRRRHHGQLRLPYAGLVDPGRTSSR